MKSFLFVATLLSSAAFANPVTFTGSVAKVVPAKKEIYVQSDTGKIELYFKPETTLTKAGTAVDFATLKEGTKVKVEANKKGKRYTPVAVEIVE